MEMCAQGFPPERVPVLKSGHLRKSNRCRGIGLIRQTPRPKATVMLSTTAALAIALCPAPPQPRFTCVHDGDTFWVEGEKIRIADIDTPELDAPDPAERLRARQARDRLIELLRTRDVRIERAGKDRFGRTLAIVDGIGDQLVAEGLARRWK